MLREAMLAVSVVANSLLPAAGASPTNGYIVLLEDGVTADTVVADLQQRHRFVASQLYTAALAGFATSLSSTAARRLAEDPRVLSVTPDVSIRAAGALEPIREGDVAPTGVRRIAAATFTEVHASASVGVAVLDTGIDHAHPELTLGEGTSCVRSERSWMDTNGHGTFVAGVIGARNNGSGVVGVAPGTVLHPVKVLDASGGGTLSQLICGLDWVAHRARSLGIKVANISIAASGGSVGACEPKERDALHRAICGVIAKGVSIVAAAGNVSSPIAQQIPAAYPEVLAVTAMADGDGEAGGRAAAPCNGTYGDDSAGPSSFGSTAEDYSHIIAAPGVCISSTLPGGTVGVDSGTSVAAAHVSGTIALCYGTIQRPGPCVGLTPALIVRRLIADAAAQPVEYGFLGDPRSGAPDRYYGHLVYAGAY